MLGLAKSDDYQPVGWVGRYPIHAATLLVIIHVLTMIGTAFALAMGQETTLAQLFFSSDAILSRGALWQFVTYAFINGPTIWFAVEMFMLFSFGREVEKFIGRRAFLALYAMLLFLPPCLLTAFGSFAPMTLGGSGSLHFAVFIAFAAIYPNVELLFSIRAKWVAAVLLAIYSLQALAGHGWTWLIVLWASSGAAFAFIARLRYGVDFSPRAFWQRLKPARQAPKLSVYRAPTKRLPDEDVMESIDPLLDKISRSGLASLTMREREKLERARSALLKKTPR